MKNWAVQKITGLGEVLIETENDAVCTISATRKAEDRGQVTPLISEAILQLEQYLQGERRDFTIPLEPKGSDFQKRVWQALREIPYGETRSYKQIAEVIGNPKGCRAVGMANNKNPILILIPCHRVIGSDGGLTGYAAGIDLKQKLLRLEAGLRFSL